MSGVSAPVDGVLLFGDALPPATLVARARRLEALGYSAIWLPDLLGRDLFATAGYLLAHTERIRIGTGIANVYGRDAMSTAQASRTLSELFDGRFVLGLGVSHPQVAEARGHAWLPPARMLRRYLTDVAAAAPRSPSPSAPAPIYIAAHGPKLLALAGQLADGANTYLMPPAHTARAREILGPDKSLNVVLPCCLVADAGLARSRSRKALAMYMALPAYRSQWTDLGWGDSDFEEGGSDRLVDALVAWGDEAAIRDRISAHREAGASQVIALPYEAGGGDAAAPSHVLDIFAPGAPAA